jgi:hypothetical protein
MAKNFGIALVDAGSTPPQGTNFKAHVAFTFFFDERRRRRCLLWITDVHRGDCTWRRCVTGMIRRPGRLNGVDRIRMAVSFEGATPP